MQYICDMRKKNARFFVVRGGIASWKGGFCFHSGMYIYIYTLAVFLSG